MFHFSILTELNRYHKQTRDGIIMEYSIYTTNGFSLHVILFIFRLLLSFSAVSLFLFPQEINCPWRLNFIKRTETFPLNLEPL